MAGLTSNLLLLIIQFMILDCTKRTLRSVYKPFGPKMCQHLCQDFTDTLFFTQKDLSCQRSSTTDSAGSYKAALKNCLRKGKRTNGRTGLDVCFNHVEDAYQPRLVRFTTESARGPAVYVGHDHGRHNISLHQACEEGRICDVQFILSQRPADINTRDKLGRTPVMAAALKRQVTVFDFLVSQNCDLMTTDNNNDTVLHMACDVGSVDIVKNLVVNHTFDIECRGWKGRTPVMRSALHGHRNVFDLLVSKGCNVTNLDNNMNNILHLACSGGHVDMVKYVFRKRMFDIESRGEKGRTPVMIASHSGHTEVFCFLASNGCNLFAVDDNKDNILHVACIGGHVHMVQHILNKTLIDIESKAKHGQTSVLKAAHHGQLAVVEFLVARGGNLTVVDGYMNTVLHVACWYGHVNIVKYVLSQQNISIDSRGPYGRTPVMTAARNGQKRVVKYLLIEGCGLTMTDNKGNNVLHSACMSGSVDMVKYVFSQTKIGIESRGQYRWTPVMTAARLGQLAIVKYFVSEGCKLSVQDSQGDNILHLACLGGHVGMVKYIFSQTKIGIESRGRYRWTPAMTAVRFGHTTVLKYLVSKGCKLSEQDSQSNNILHLACLSRHVDMVKYIFSQTKFGKESRGRNKWTPVMTAVSVGEMTVVKFLVSKGCKLSELDSQGSNILHVACMSGKVNMVKYVFSETKIGIESRGQYGMTPVMTAVAHSHMAVAKYLVSKGCKLSITNDHGDNILHVVCIGGHIDLVKYIFSICKISVESIGYQSWTPVMTAAFYGHTSVVRFFVGKRCKLSIVDEKGMNILQVACMGGHEDVVKYLNILRSWSNTC